MAFSLPFPTLEKMIPTKGGTVLIAKFDIFMRLPDGQPIWVEAVESLEEARKQLSDLRENTCGEYFIFNSTSGQVIAS